MTTNGDGVGVLWVIEVDYGKGWIPSSLFDQCITRETARMHLRNARFRWPHMNKNMRIRKYVRA